MEQQPSRPASAQDSVADPWTWTIVAGLLVLGVIVGAGSMAIMKMNEQGQRATGSQTTTSPR